MEDRLRPEYLNELLEGMRNSADVSQPIEDEKEEATAPTSRSVSYARSI
jgi:hypothetical protein